MNGELYQLSKLVLYVKRSMRTGIEEAFSPGNHESRIVFSFIPKKLMVFRHAEECGDALSWMKSLKKRNLRDIHLISFFEEDNIQLAGFANSLKQGIVTEYTNGKTTFWAVRSEFDKDQKAWSYFYKEFDWTGRRPAAYTFDGCREGFEKVLLDIEKLARELVFESFAGTFRGAYDILAGDNPPSVPEWMKNALQDLEGERLRLFLAASRADVFGGMGSWNDDPACRAHTDGLEADYKRLSHDLYVSVRKALMNAVNG